MSREDFEDYKEGFEAGKEAVEDQSVSDSIQDHIDVFMGRYDDKSEMWWRGFEDGKESNWDPPDEEEQDEEESEE